MWLSRAGMEAVGYRWISPARSARTATVLLSKQNKTSKQTTTEKSLQVVHDHIGLGQFATPCVMS